MLPLTSPLPDASEAKSRRLHHSSVNISSASLQDMASFKSQATKENGAWDAGFRICRCSGSKAKTTVTQRWALGFEGTDFSPVPELITCFCLGAQELVAMITLVHPASTAIVIHTHTPPPYRTMVSESGWGNASLTPDH